MKTTLKNDVLSVEVDSKGAELASIRMGGAEYLWQGTHPDFWKERAPVLFPVVGLLANNQYAYAGKTYDLGIHGFARFKEFTLVSSSADSATFRLTHSDETLAVYPFRFTLDLTYRLQGNTVVNEYRVVNEDEKLMYFSVGGHPGFNVPLEPGSDFEDWYLEFDQPEVLDRILVGKFGMLGPDKERVLTDESILPLKNGMFTRGAFVFEGYRSQSLALRSAKSKKSVKVDFPGFPLLGVWAMHNAPYVCIEPWHGVNDLAGCDGNIEHKYAIRTLEPGKQFVTEFSITVE